MSNVFHPPCGDVYWVFYFLAAKAAYARASIGWDAANSCQGSRPWHGIGEGETDVTTF